MKLSELVYQAVKNVKYLEDDGFTYDAFLEGEYDNDQDYANSINNAMAPINEAIHRLSDRNKIAYEIGTIGFVESDLVDISMISRIKKIKSMFYKTPDGFEYVGWREFGKGFVIVDRVLNAPLYIQYIQDIPAFKMSDVRGDSDPDLQNYGISETMCDYIVEYVQGKLQETIAPELANLHVTRAEQYFDDLEEQQNVFTQRKVTKKYRI